MTDVAARQRTERWLRLLSAALESAANGIIITDRQGGIIWANPAFTLLTGYTAKEALGQNPRVLKSGQHDQAFYRSLWETILVGQVWHGETVNRRKDGSLYTEAQTITPVYDERGEISHFIAIKQDVTDRKQAESEIRELNLQLKQRAERLQAINRLTKVITASLDLESLYQHFAREVKLLIPYERMGIILLGNADTEFRISERTSDGPTFRELHRILSREEREAVEWVMAQRQPHIEPDLAEARQFGKDEALLTMGIRSCVRLPMIVKGKPIGVLCLLSVEPYRYGACELEFLVPLSEQLAVAIDSACLYQAATEATEALKCSQTALLETERLRAMGELAAGVAHDFNNALTGLLGQTLLIRTLLQATPIPTEIIQEALARQEQVALDAAETVRRIREATRPRGSEAFVSIALEEMIRAVIEITRPRWKNEAERQGIRITVTTELSPLPLILGRESELREAFTNLLLNAVDAMPTGGTITIATSRIGECVEVTVTDTGTGIAEAVQARLFEPFFTTKGPRGTGLGLSMVQGIVRRHGGEIRMVSSLGAGTSVRLKFPVAATDAAAVEAATPVAVAAPRKLKILVIDDILDLAQICCALLTEMGHEVEVAGTGQAGVARLAEERFDLVMTDLGMPEMSGWEVASAVKSSFPACPVILVTGWGEVAHELEGTGVDLILGKPYTRQNIEAVIDQVLRACSN